MCYRCSVCEANVGPKINLNRHVIYREVARGPYLPPRLEIAKELPICKPCKDLLDAGFPLVRVKHMRKPKAAPINPPASAPALQAESVF